MEDAAGMAVLREAACARANGACQICGKPCPLESGELIHIKARGRGGSDTLENLEWGHHDCHFKRDHPGPQWSPLIRGDGRTPGRTENETQS
jgi:5-methylcytosine-specific restriction endonuclease McrA